MSEHEPVQSGEFYLRHAGRIIWPRHITDLTDTSLCPACHAPLKSPVCSACRLDLRRATASALLASSADAAAALNRRAELIGRIRYETAPGRVSAPQPVAVVPRAASSSSASSSSANSSSLTLPAPVQPTVAGRVTPRAALPTAPPVFDPTASTRVQRPVEPPRGPSSPPPGAAPALPAKPQRSSVQVVLLSIGVLLVSVAAIFFLTVAWIVAGLGFRSVVVALLTVAALVVAARMRRSRLTSTAEGIGSFAVVLVLLDVWGMRQNNLFGLAAGDGALYWGVALTVCAALFLGWHDRSNLRVGSVAGFAVAAPSIGLLAAGLFQGQETLTRVFVGFLGAAVGALLHRVTLPRPAAVMGRRPVIDRFPERMLLLTLGALALVTSGIVAVFVESDSLIAPVWCLGAVTVVATAHVVLVLRAPQSALKATIAPPPAGLSAPARPAGIAAAMSALLAQPADVHATNASVRFMAEYRSFAYVSAVLAAVAAAGIVPVIAGRFGNLPFALTTPVLVAVALAVALEVLGRRFVAPTAARTAGLVAAGSAAIVGVIPLLLTGWYATRPLAQATENGVHGQEIVTDLATADNSWALFALVGIGVILLIGWTLGGLIHARRQIVTALTLIVIVLAVPFVESVGVIVALYLLLGAGALASLLLARKPKYAPTFGKGSTTGRFSLGFLTPGFVGLLITGETFGYFISWAHPTTWWFGTVSLVLALWFARLLVTLPASDPVPAGPAFTTEARAHARGALLAAAIVVTLIGFAHVPLALAPDQNWSEPVNLANVTAALALATALLHLLVGAAALRPTVLPTLERRWAFFTLLVPSVVVFVLPIGSWSLAADESLLQPEPFGSLVRTGLLVAACALWVFLRANRGTLHAERAIAAVALAPLLLLLVREVVFATDAVASVVTLAPPAVALVVCSLALFRGSVATGPGAAGAGAAGIVASSERVDRFAPRDRIALEIGAVIVLVPAAFTAAVTFRSLGWLVVVLAGIVALILAIAPDGLFGSRSNRRHFGWLALALGTAGLWLGLAWAGTVALEPYVLPVAGVVLVTAALIRRYGQIDRASTASPVAALLTLAALLIALAPLALAAQSGSLVRAVVVALVAAALVLGAGAVQWSPPRSHYLAAAALAGSVVLVITAVAQTLRLRGAPDARLELWLLVPAAVAVATAFLLARHADAASAPLRRGASIALVLVWASVVTWIELAVAIAPADAGLSTPRALLLVVALSAVHVLALWRPNAPFGALTAWSVLALAGLAAFTAASFGAVDPFELVTVPVALALLGSGWLRLHSDSRARSWPWIGPGLLLLLMPSLLLDLTYSDLWRIVSLGIVAITVLVIGSTRRLQAPFLIGAGVLLIHGIAQLWPWIALAYSAIPWFLWLGGGGIVLIVLAARYEQRIANLKSVALRISALR
ncbi:hypothetical protein [Cryobacterium sp. PH31-O1]|uniref:SCO7613 C-terminal domain-containing membrane protein n=1 Tax=Cryobacterium sp. PH31-O1 TaxID=3046306 RepID=UPI0024BBA019|nr:hypothetical protein [Cryobacterium sp. PH31-O1]MDJ0339721.1 hypothetical protein [Cryobacterium sp. PH31-O1]